MRRIMLWAWLMGLVAMTAGAQGVAKKLPELKESAYTHWVGTWATAQQPVVKSFMRYNKIGRASCRERV